MGFSKHARKSWPSGHGGSLMPALNGWMPFISLLFVEPVTVFLIIRSTVLSGLSSQVLTLGSAPQVPLCHWSSKVKKEAFVLDWNEFALKKQGQMIWALIWAKTLHQKLFAKETFMLPWHWLQLEGWVWLTRNWFWCNSVRLKHDTRVLDKSCEIKNMGKSKKRGNAVVVAEDSQFIW